MALALSLRMGMGGWAMASGQFLTSQRTSLSFKRNHKAFTPKLDKAVVKLCLQGLCEDMHITRVPGWNYFPIFMKYG